MQRKEIKRRYDVWKEEIEIKCRSNNVCWREGKHGGDNVRQKGKIKVNDNCVCVLMDDGGDKRKRNGCSYGKCCVLNVRKKIKANNGNTNKRTIVRTDNVWRGCQG